MTLHHCLSFSRHRFGHCPLCNVMNPCPSSSGALSTRCKPLNLPISMLQCILMGLRSWLSSNASACNAGGTCSIQGWEDPLDDGMATPSNILDCRIPWTEEPGIPQGFRVGHHWRDWAHTHPMYKQKRCILGGP